MIHSFFMAGYKASGLESISIPNICCQFLKQFRSILVQFFSYFIKPNLIVDGDK